MGLFKVQGPVLLPRLHAMEPALEKGQVGLAN